MARNYKHIYVISCLQVSRTKDFKVSKTVLLQTIEGLWKLVNLKSVVTKDKKLVIAYTVDMDAKEYGWFDGRGRHFLASNSKMYVMVLDLEGMNLLLFSLFLALTLILVLILTLVLTDILTLVFVFIYVPDLIILVLVLILVLFFSFFTSNVF